jgi:hypothetical protein
MPPAILAGQGSAVAQDTSQRQIRRCRRRDRQRTTVATTIRPCRRCRKRRSNRPGKPPCQSPKWSNLHSAWRQRNGQTTRDFLHWRFSDAGNPREPSQTPCNGVRETCTFLAVRCASAFGPERSLGFTPGAAMRPVIPDIRCRCEVQGGVNGGNADETAVQLARLL